MMQRGKNVMIQLEIKPDGRVNQVKTQPGLELLAESMPINAIYPEVKMAIVRIPTRKLKPEQQIAVRNALTRIVIPNPSGEPTTYKMFGAGGGLKDGKLLFVEEQYQKQLHSRFKNWPEALLAYSGILTSDCMTLVTFDECRVAVVDDPSSDTDRAFGTNDCGGWISERCYKKFSRKEKVVDSCTGKAIRNSDGSTMYRTVPLPLDCLTQGRLASIGHNHCSASSLGQQAVNAKPSFKIMQDDVADALGVDFIIPRSAQKPSFENLTDYNAVEGTLPSEINLTSRLFVGRVVVGIRDFSRPNTFECSATITQNIPAEIVQEEILPAAIEGLNEIIAGWYSDDRTIVVNKIGRVNKRSSDAEERSADYEPADLEAASIVDKPTQRFVEAILLADNSKEYLAHPYIYDQLSKLLAKRAVKWCTGGMIHLPAFALSHDGYLMLSEDGRIRWGSDWLDKDMIITELESGAGLGVRYPVRDGMDLLPLLYMTDTQIIERLMARSLNENEASWAIAKQLRLASTLTMNSEKAKENGGDFDFDQVCLIDSARYMRTVAHFFNLDRPDNSAVKKTKGKRAQSPIFNLVALAVSATGNSIGIITDNMSTCAAYGRYDLVALLKVELQLAIDGLKHGTFPDMEKVKTIMSDLERPEFLTLKHKKKLTELPEQIKPASAFDVVALVYNTLRPKFTELLGKKRGIVDYKGILDGVVEGVSLSDMKSMTAEVSKLRSLTGSVYAMLSERSVASRKALDAAKLARDEAKKTGDLIAISLAWEDLNSIQAQDDELQMALNKSRGNVARFIAGWGRGKTINRKAWAQAFNQSICAAAENSKKYDRKNGKEGQITQYEPSGSGPFLAFPQECIDAVADITGGTNSLVEPDKGDFTVVIEDDHFYTVLPTGERQLEFIHSYAYSNEKLEDGITHRYKGGFKFIAKP